MSYLYFVSGIIFETIYANVTILHLTLYLRKYKVLPIIPILLEMNING